MTVTGSRRVNAQARVCPAHRINYCCGAGMHRELAELLSGSPGSLVRNTAHMKHVVDLIFGVVELCR